MSEPINHDLLARIPLTARAILDVGCGEGGLGVAYRRRNPRARLFGIDRDHARALAAAAVLDEVANVDLDRTPMPFPADTRLDCIIYGDVLEHLADPARVLRAHLRWLAEDGCVLVCIPNVEHWSFAARLLDGSWRYEPSGLLDATHLRWFTTTSMRALLEEAGLNVLDVTARVFDNGAHAAFVAAMTPSLTALGIDPADYAARSAPLQTVWRASRLAPRRLLVAAHQMRPQGGVSHVRIVYPQAAIGTDPSMSVALITDGMLPEIAVSVPKILILHRMTLAGAAGRRSLRGLLASGWMVVSECDDHPDFLARMQTDDLLSFTGVHAVQTSTEALAEVLRARNPHVMVFPNTIREIQPPRNFTDPTRLGLFFGAFNREADWQDWMPALNQVLALAGERMPVTVMHDRAFFDALSTPHKNFLPMSDHPTYLDQLAGCEVSLMPLTDTAFNRTKSDLKFIEAAAARVLAIASPTVYGASIDDGRTGFVVDGPSALAARLAELLNDPARGRDIADRARAEVVEKRMLADQVGARVRWYQQLWDRRAELTLELLARVPDLGADPATPARVEIGS